MACRICLEGDESAALISPCACKGSVEFVHQHCVDAWHEEKVKSTGESDGACTLCRQPERAPVMFDVEKIIGSPTSEGLHRLMDYVARGDRRARSLRILDAGLMDMAKKIEENSYTQTVSLGLVVLVSHLSRRKESILDALNFVCDVVAGNDCDMVYSLAKRFSHAYNLTAQMLMMRAVTLSRVPEDMRRVERCVRTVFRLRSEKQLSKTGRTLHGEKHIILGLRIVIAQACEAMKSEHIQAAIDVVDAIYREAGMDMWALCPAESSLALSAVMAHDRRVARHVLGPTPRLRSACKARRSGAEMALKIKSRAWLRRAACL